MESKEIAVCSTVDSVIPCPCSPISSSSTSSPITSSSVFPLFSSSLPDPNNTCVRSTIDHCHPSSSLEQHSNVIPFTTFTSSDPYWWKEAHSRVSMFDGILSGGLASKEDLLEIGFSPFELHSATHFLSSSPPSTEVSHFLYPAGNFETAAKHSNGCSASADYPEESSSSPCSSSYRVGVKEEEAVLHPLLSPSSAVFPLESPHPAALPHPYFFASSASLSPSVLPLPSSFSSPSTFHSATAGEVVGGSACATRWVFAQTSSGPRVISACAEELPQLGTLNGCLSCAASACRHRANSSSLTSPSSSVGATRCSTASSVAVSSRKRNSDVLSRVEEECTRWKRERIWWDSSRHCTTEITEARSHVPDEIAYEKAFTPTFSRSRIGWDYWHRGALLEKVSRGGGASMNSASLPWEEAESSEIGLSSRARGSTMVEQSLFSSCRNDNFHNTALLFNGADYCPLDDY